MNVLPFEGKKDPFGNDGGSLNNFINPTSGGVLWSILKPDAPTRITQSLLSEFVSVQSDLLTGLNDNKLTQPINYHVLSSDIPDVFTLGGDLKYFSECAKDKNKEHLLKYARDSIDFVYNTATNYHLPITTISLVKGAAFGGGFETALAANYIIAEEHSTFAFPETRFGLFPGMGAYTFLRQRVPSHIAEEIIYSSKEYSAQELYEMNVIDRICERGQGNKTTMQFIQKRHQRHPGIQAMRKMVQHYTPIDKQELHAIVDHWVESVLNLDAKTLRLIEALSQTSMRHSRTV